jgi:hypothetical protein
MATFPKTGKLSGKNWFHEGKRHLLHNQNEKRQLRYAKFSIKKTVNTEE